MLFVLNLCIETLLEQIYASIVILAKYTFINSTHTIMELLFTFFSHELIKTNIKAPTLPNFYPVIRTCFIKTIPKATQMHLKYMKLI